MSYKRTYRRVRFEPLKDEAVFQYFEEKGMNPPNKGCYDAFVVEKPGNKLYRAKKGLKNSIQDIERNYLAELEDLQI